MDERLMPDKKKDMEDWEMYSPTIKATIHPTSKEGKYRYHINVAGNVSKGTGDLYDCQVQLIRSILKE